MYYNRRIFLKSASASTIGAVAASGFGSALTGINAYAADTTGYKALVCLFLFGGLDNYDTLLPYDQPSYDRFADIRQTLFNQYGSGSTRERSRLLPLSPADTSNLGGRQYALPEELAGLHSLFENGNAAIVNNVGPLITPINRSEWEANSAVTPKRLFSHNDQQSTWLSNAPEGATFGWGGFFADATIGGVPTAGKPFATMATFPGALFLSGRETQPYQVGFQGAARVQFFDDFLDFRSDPQSIAAHAAMRTHFSSSNFTGTNLLQRDFANANASALETNERYATALETALPFTTEFPNGFLGSQLRGVAQAISVRDALSVNRQVFFVGLGGFDTHSSQAGELPELQQEMGDGIAAFYAALQEIGVANDVTLFTASDFGRTLTVNGDGTDHGWGATHFVVGGAVAGRQIYGAVPPYDFDHDFDAGSGRLIPTTSVEQFAAPLGAWFGLNNGELAQALPNLSNFDAPPSVLTS